MATAFPSPSIPPSTLDAMIQGERMVLDSLLDLDPAYRYYVRRHQSERIGEPMGPREFHESRNELARLYGRTRAPKVFEDIEDLPADRALRIKRIYHLEWLLFA